MTVDSTRERRDCTAALIGTGSSTRGKLYSNLLLLHLAQHKLYQGLRRKDQDRGSPPGRPGGPVLDTAVLPVHAKQCIVAKFGSGTKRGKQTESVLEVENPMSAKREEDIFCVADELCRLIDHGAVALLKGSWMAENWHILREAGMNRQELLRRHPEAFADANMVRKILREVEIAATWDRCLYPGLVVMSYCWQTPAHPDPTGSLLQTLSPMLRWYANQRAKYVEER
eukprot:1147789-Rhodomonas_salina.1